MGRKFMALLWLEMRRMWLPVLAYIVAFGFIRYYQVHRIGPFPTPEAELRLKQLLPWLNGYISMFGPAALFLYSAVTDHLSGRRLLMHSLPAPAWSHMLAKAGVMCVLVATFDSAVTLYLRWHAVSYFASGVGWTLAILAYSPHLLTVFSIAVGMLAYTAAVMVRRLPVAAGLVTLLGMQFFLMMYNNFLQRYLYMPVGFLAHLLYRQGSFNYYMEMRLLLHLMDTIPALFIAAAALWLYNRFGEV